MGSCVSVTTVQAEGHQHGEVIACSDPGLGSDQRVGWVPSGDASGADIGVGSVRVCCDVAFGFS